jgi:hypothetical protein
MWVVADASGKLLAAHMIGTQEPGAPTEVTLVPAAGQALHQVAVPNGVREAA